MRTWLYRIATNACLTALSSKDRRVLPAGLGAGTDDSASAQLQHADAVSWLEPAPTAALTGSPSDPATIVAVRENTRLALVAAFQALPARQRAVLMLVDVAGYTPTEAADLLSVTVTAARSLLQRAREALAARHTALDAGGATGPDGQLLERYLEAFESADIELLTRLLRADVEYEMPPHALWFVGRQAVLDHHRRRVFGHRSRALPTSANGFPAIASYGEAGDGTFTAHAIHVLEARGEQIERITVFIDDGLFEVFGLPASLPPLIGGRAQDGIPSRPWTPHTHRRSVGSAD